jgi:hypothetical protein
MNIILRDDDISYFTKISDLEKFYAEIPYVKPSFAIISDYIPNHFDLFSRETVHSNQKCFFENLELVDYIKQFDYYMHGITHYNIPVPEFVNSVSEENLIKIKAKFKENGMDTNWFVAPCNKLSYKNYLLLKKYHFNLSGAFFDKCLGICKYLYPKNYINKRYNNYIINVIKHKGALELPYFNFGPNKNTTYFYNLVQRKDINNIQIAIHSWELQKYNIKEKELLYDFLDFCKYNMNCNFIGINSLNLEA